MGDHNFQEVIQKVTMYLDNELSAHDEKELLRQIQANPSYFKILDREKSFRALVKNQLQRRAPSPALVRSIKEKVNFAPPHF